MTAHVAHLSHRLLRGVLLAAGGASLLFGLLFLGLYRSQLENERAEASLQLNRMLQVTWENAMLKRDVEGLRDIVGKLGALPGIRDVLILAPAGEVRFASDAAKLGRQMPAVAQATTAGKPLSRFETLDSGSEVLRSINPVPNRAPCTPCHGAVAAHPVNGVLVIDYDAAPIRASAMASAIVLLAAGTAALGLTLATLWLLLRRHVIRPLAGLDAATRALAAGDLAVRAPVASDDEIGRAAMSFNIMAERLETQVALLHANKTYLQEILDGLPDGVRVIRVADKQVVLANRAFCQQSGLPLEEITRGPCYLSHGRQEPCIATMLVCPLAELKQVGDTLKANHRHQRPDGNQFPAEIHAVLVEIESSGRRERYIVESVRDLGQAVSISHEQRLSELGLLAAGIAHEIHNPLGSVRLGVQGLVREVRAGHIAPEQIVDYMGLIDQEIDNCIAVTRRLLLLARPPANSMQLVVINEALADTLRLLEYDAQTHGIAQQIDLPDTSLRILADEAEIRMIFLNLIQNAHHAMPSGGTLSARLAADDGGHAIIEIADSGVGMTPETVAHIFDPFFSQRADRVNGTGLGLTIVKNFVERMNGTIAVDSTLGQGTRFSIRLPLAETALESGA